MRLPTALAMMLWAQAALAADATAAGVWELAGGDVEVAFEGASDNSYTIVWHDGPWLGIAPGTIVGTATAGAAAGSYDVHLQVPAGAIRPGSHGQSSVKAVLRIDPADPAQATLQPYTDGYAVSLWRLLPPPLPRIGIQRRDTRPADLDGARRAGAPPRSLEP